MNGKDYYAILGVGRKATEKEIRQAYRRLAKKHHPDRNRGDKGAEAKFKEINEAYGVLSDPEKRSQYDQFGRVGQAWQQAGGPQGHSHAHSQNAGPGFDFGNLGDLFETFFGSPPRAGARPGTGGGRQDLSYPVELSLQEAYTGATRVIELNLPESCPTCKGRGATREGLRTCPACGGSGQPSGRRGYFTLTEVCDQCEGRGEVIVRPCQNCRGLGRVQRPRRLEVKIPAGVAEGQKIRAAGQGPGGGDLFLVAHLKADPFFSRKGDDLWCEVPITFAEAALGAEIEVPTLNGKVRVAVPAETSSGQALRLSGLGFPKLKGPGRGDQYVKVRIVVPKRLNPEEKGLIQQLGALRPEKPRG